MALFDTRDPSTGIAGDGVADDSEALQRLLDAAGLAGATVRVPRGTYNTSRSLLVRSGTRIVGDGPGSLLRDVTGSRPILELTRGVADVVIAGLSFAGRPAPGHVGGRGAVYLNPSPGEAVSARRVRIDRCRFFDVSTGAITVSHAEEVAVADCLIDGAFEHGIYVSSSRDVSVRDNSVRGAGSGAAVGFGVMIKAATAVAVRGNRIRASRDDGLIIEYGCVDVIASENQIADAGGRGIRLSGDAAFAAADGTPLAYDRPTAILIAHNLIRSPGREGIRCLGGRRRGAAGVRLSGNIIAGLAPGSSGLALDPSTAGFVVSENQIAGDPPPGFGLRIAGDGHLVAHNAIAGATIAGIRIDPGARDITLLGNVNPAGLSDHRARPGP